MPKNAKFAMMEKLAREKGNTTMGEFFIKDGLDYKGQEQHAWSVSGFGAGADVKIDPGKLVGLTGAVGVQASVTRSQEVMVVAQVGPALARYETLDGAPREEPLQRPITLTCMQGIMWEGKAGASFELGVGFSAEAKISVMSGASSEAKSSLEDEEEDEDEPVFDPEILGAKFEAFAGFKASASYTYSNVALEDVWPSFYGVNVTGAEKSNLKDDCEEIFTLGSRKDAARTKAVEWMNRNQAEFGFQKTSSYLFWDRSAASITQALIAGAAKCNPRTMQGIVRRAMAQNWASKLFPYNGGARQRGLNILTLSSHAPEGRAGVEASFEASAGLGPLAGAEASAAVRGPTVAGKGKWSSYRFQTFWNIDGGDQLLMYTQETKITYTAVDLTLLSVEAKAEGSVMDPRSLRDTVASVKTVVQERDLGAFEKPKRIGFTTEDIRGKDREEGNRGFASLSQTTAQTMKKLATDGLGLKKQWNTMSYQSACLYWARPDAEAQCVGRKATALPGSGFSLGRSTTLSTLDELMTTCKFFEYTAGEAAGGDKDSKGRIHKLEMICAALHVKKERLIEAFKDENVASLITDLGSSSANVDAEEGQENDDLALLIEVGFAVPLPEFDIEVRNKKYWGKGENLPEGEWVAKLDKDFMDKAVTAFNGKTLDQLDSCINSFRIRLRMADVENNDSSFQLGFKIAGQELNVKLNRVDRAGASGVIDLATFWYPRELREGGPAAYEQGVPKVALFDQ